MQLVALRTSQQSSFQTMGVQLASEMADSMRANADQMGQPDSTNPFLAVSYNSGTGADPTRPKNCYGANVCTSLELANFNIYEWQMRVKEVLPAGRVRICRDETPSESGALSWDCNYSASTANNAPMVIKVGWRGKDKDATNVFPPSVAITVESYTQ